MNQKAPLEILRDDLRKLNKEELIDMLVNVIQVKLLTVIVNYASNTQKLNNVIRQECANIEQSLAKTVKKVK